MGFREKLEQGQSVKLLETVPPKKPSLDKIISNLKNFKGKIDATTVVDSPLGTARMQPLPVAEKIQRELGIETIMHFICRDRNRIEIEAQLLAASALGIQNILALTGDPTPEAKQVFEFYSVTLIDFISKFAKKHGTEFFVGAGLNINAKDIASELMKAEKKIDAGARFFITQPCFDVDKLKMIKLGVPIIAGVLIVSNKEIYDYFKQVPGIEIPVNLENILDDEGKSIDFYKKLISELKETAAGICLMPIGNYEIVEELLK